MVTEVVKIPKNEYILLKKKAAIADDAIVQLSLSLEDLKKGKISKF